MKRISIGRCQMSTNGAAGDRKIVKILLICGEFLKFITFAAFLYGIMLIKTSCRCYVVFNVVRNESDEKRARCG